MREQLFESRNLQFYFPEIPDFPDLVKDNFQKPINWLFSVRLIMSMKSKPTLHFIEYGSVLGKNCPVKRFFGSNKTGLQSLPHDWSIIADCSFELK